MSKIPKLKEEYYTQQIINSIQQLEELGGPSIPDYIDILKTIERDIKARIYNAENHYKTLQAFGIEE